MDLEVLAEKPLDQVQEMARWALEKYDYLTVWAFEGGVGAGKTTFAIALAKELKLRDLVQSPTFSLVNEYDEKVYHFDCYRLKNLEEALDFGMEEYLDSKKKCWIEWPQIITPLLIKPYLKITIEHTQSTTRNFYFEVIK